MAQSRSGASRGGSKTSAKTTRSSASRKAAAKKGGAASARKTTARKAASGTSRTAARGARGAGFEAKTVAEFREALRKNLMKPMEMVMLSRERIEEVLGEAVDQGRVTTRDAQRIASGLVKRGEKQTKDVLGDLEELLNRGRDEIEGTATRARKRAGGAAKGARGAASGAGGRASRAASPALARVDKVRRGAGVGPSFPILRYDSLKANEIQSRLRDLTAAELRKVRDHEKRHANRKTILSAIESKLR
jgi:polyhydroxyalkanoate synthesis regulator phasin